MFHQNIYKRIGFTFMDCERTYCLAYDNIVFRLQRVFRKKNYTYFSTIYFIIFSFRPLSLDRKNNRRSFSQSLSRGEYEINS